MFLNENLQTPVSAEYDVVVAGGGIAGIAAALSAARSGAKTALIEKECLPGGLATLGLVTIYLPLCDGMGNQVIYGIGEELLRLSVSHKMLSERGKSWIENGTAGKNNGRFEVSFNPHLFALEAERLLLENGVEILYDTRICETAVNDGRIEHVIIENTSGRSAIRVKAVADCTGNAEICKFSGAKTTVRTDNAIAAWHYSAENGKVKLNMCGAMDNGNPTEFIGGFKYTGVTADEVNGFLMNSHKTLLGIVSEHTRENPDYEPVTIPAIPQLRMTRRLSGAYELDECEQRVHFNDSIGLSPDWRKRGPVYELPFRSLYGSEVKNLITAGRCISVSDSMWDITRVIPVCAVTGEAAGAAAAMLIDSFEQLDVTALQKTLENRGVKIHL